MKKIVTLFLTLAFLAGCASTQVVTLTSSFDHNETAKLLQQGVGTIKGSALIRQQGGGIVTCAGTQVVLIPATEYAKERIEKIYGSSDHGYQPAFGFLKIIFKNDALEYSQMQVKADCDAQGFFKFENVTNGSFFVISRIIWGTSPYVKEGGFIMQRVNITHGETKEIVLSP